MLSWLLVANTLLLTLRLSNGGSFPKPLMASEEREWLTRLRDGDPQTRNVLIERNLRLVAHIVEKYYAQSGEQENLSMRRFLRGGPGGRTENGHGAFERGERERTKGDMAI